MVAGARSLAEAFYEAFCTRDPARIAPFLASDVEWVITGPVDLLRYCGHRHGKAAVLELYARVFPEIMAETRILLDDLLIDGDRAAALSRVSATERRSGRVISYRCAQFMWFAGGKLKRYCAVFDSFDAAEQVLGHQIDITRDNRPRDNDVAEIVAL
jgi:ketosteroid isomerase-like protein